MGMQSCDKVWLLLTCFSPRDRTRAFICGPVDTLRTEAAAVNARRVHQAACQLSETVAGMTGCGGGAPSAVHVFQPGVLLLLARPYVEQKPAGRAIVGHLGHDGLNLVGKGMGERRALLGEVHPEVFRKVTRDQARLQMGTVIMLPALCIMRPVGMFHRWTVVA